ncbi:Protein fem-1-like protein C [Colletotrichum sidae]|uniref:Protein fem-1-like protein C n=1 Tax=Colletotrichum sidae TaxID=1347389 RepID=A0A4R8TKK0_9PEZI|nr:Protein fem-1-like protein C [Colletotrichum sidae]
MIDLLLEEGANVNQAAANYHGATALQVSAIKGYLGIAEVLIDRGAHVDAKRAAVGGRTALEGAAEHGRIDIIQYLLSMGSPRLVPDGYSICEPSNLPSWKDTRSRQICFDN